jgi:tetratricopeptide (TPR) repeat protein
LKKVLEKEQEKEK